MVVIEGLYVLIVVLVVVKYCWVIVVVVVFVVFCSWVLCIWLRLMLIIKVVILRRIIM